MDLLALSPRVVTWIVAAIAVTGVIIRPFNIMEAIWPVGAVAVLLLFGLIKPDVALAGVAKGTDVYLFLTGMIQHHTGALVMVKDLFRMPGAGQDPRLFDFASDVDNTQQAEIDIMKHMLKEKQ